MEVSLITDVCCCSVFYCKAVVLYVCKMIQQPHRDLSRERYLPLLFQKPLSLNTRHSSTTASHTRERYLTVVSPLPSFPEHMTIKYNSLTEISEENATPQNLMPKIYKFNGYKGFLWK